MKVCYVISYKAPEYIRSKALIEALKNIPEVDVFVVKNTSKGIKRYFQTLKEFLRIRFREKPDVYFIGFRGHEIFPIIKILTLGKPIIFDEMVSPYDSLKNENREGFLGRVFSIFVYPLEYFILHLVSLILTDTELHREFMIKQFRLDPEEVKTVYVGSEQIEVSGKKRAIDPDKNSLTVFFYGNFYPLHGIKYILEAAKEVKMHPVTFIIVGGRGRNIKEFTEYIRDNELTNVKHYEWMNFDDLFRNAMDSDICLGGPFGDTSQASRIITGKTFQFLSLGMPTVIGKIDLDVGFEDKVNCILVNRADCKELTEAILWCLNNKGKLSDIGDEGQKLFIKKFSVDALKIEMEDILAKYKKQK